MTINKDRFACDNCQWQVLSGLVLLLTSPFPQQSGTNLFLNGIVLGIVGLGGSLLSAGQIKPGDLMAFLVATQTIQRSRAQLSLLFGHYVRGTSAGSRVFEVIFNFYIYFISSTTCFFIWLGSTAPSNQVSPWTEAKLFLFTLYSDKLNLKTLILPTQLVKIRWWDQKITLTI